MKQFFADFSKLIKFRLTFLVVFSASITFLIGSQVQINGVYPDINWLNWLKLIVGGFLVTSAANCFNEVIEVDLDKLMTRTKDRPMPAGHMTTGQGLVSGLVMGLLGTWLLGSLNLVTGLLSVFSIFLYAFAYTPMKRKSPIAVFIGAIPGALPPLIGYVAAHGKIDQIAVILFLIQFVWQFPHFWSIAWVLDDDYKKAGFRLLPTTKRDKASAFITLLSALILVPVSLLPTFYGFGGYYIAGVSLIASLVFAWFSFKLWVNLDLASARKVMFCSFFYLPLVQLILLFDFIAK
ncbi:polyprenyltransferase (cytochrome oxidase assembly factor) [Pedobacter sp. BAL39]|uniref:heme o synthase n=1 Tax=Pedobacter sp. BAL39 TaxID=391596 RepID=UPI0001559EE8|nr:heme o synthase [Pedobacter sp. BAL39]EDM37400.1 polyprenyltransferase (cytochrome oxidase assembly factor) [Pedobacter sp. BAL39]